MTDGEESCLVEIDHCVEQYQQRIPYVYLASPLTGVSSAGRRRNKSLRSAVKSLLESNGRLPMLVYDPACFTAPGSKHSPEEVFQIDHTHVVKADLVVVLRTSPSDGVGIELTIAGNAGVPHVLLEYSKVPVSRMILGSPSRRLAQVSFSTENELIIGLQVALESICKGVVERMPAKRRLLQDLAIAARGRDILRRRLKKGVSREELAICAGCTEAWIAATEIDEAFTLLLGQSMMWDIGTALCATPQRSKKQRFEILVDDDEVAVSDANIDDSLGNLVDFVKADRRLNDELVLKIWRDYEEMQTEAVAGRFETHKPYSLDDWRHTYRNAQQSLGL